jgi:hypothetical protein
MRTNNIAGNYMKIKLSALNKLMMYLSNQSLFVQLLILFAFSSILIQIASLSLGLEKTLTIFLDPGNFDLELNNTVLGFVILALGIILSGTIISLINNGLEKTVRAHTLEKTHNLLIEAFQTIPTILTRNLVRDLNIQSELRRLNIIDTEVRLELPRDEVIDAIRMYGKLRLRKNKNDDSIVLEHFNENRSYGYYENNNSPLTIISTQNYSDPGIGHFSYTIAKNLGANYISNEYFSSGSLLKRKQINFSTNEYYTNHNMNAPEELVQFYTDVSALMSTSKVVINFATASAERANHIHVMFGGEKGKQGFEIENRTIDSLDSIKDFYNDLSDQMKTIGELNVVTHDELGNSNKNHLSWAIRKEFNIDVITLSMSLNILHSDSDVLYFKSIKALCEAIEKHYFG